MTAIGITLEAVKLASRHGADPQEVGKDDGSEDDWGDLVYDAAVALGHDPETMPDDEWQHFQTVAANCQSTTMLDWLTTLEAIPQ